MESLSNNPEAHGWTEQKSEGYDITALVNKVRQLQFECEMLRKIIVKMCLEKYLGMDGERND